MESLSRFYDQGERPSGILFWTILNLGIALLLFSSIVRDDLGPKKSLEPFCAPPKLLLDQKITPPQSLDLPTPSPMECRCDLELSGFSLLIEV
mmetsp:Transcript_11222/g.30988  ORF Transcript_11222/g.30988 Transcript_11222/m.30988 type:complete len:93 (+) Transcript_11222:2665-2943(+)